MPVYDEEPVLPLVREEITRFLNEMPCPAEVILVNDGSRDRSVELLFEWASEDSRIKVMNLARNFGHQAAATAGLDSATGDAVVLMDADLQDPPSVILQMLAEYCQGYDVVYGRRTSRKGETWFKRLTAWLFYRLMSRLIHRDLPTDVGDFRLMSRRCLDALKMMRETHRFLRGMVAWVGFPQTAVSYVREARAGGTTKYSLWKMLRFAWNATLSFSPMPLQVSFVGGLFLAAAGLAYGTYAVVRTLLGLYTVPGWTSLIVITCLTSGAILISIGILGEYIGRIFDESKGRPLYIVATTANFDEAGCPAVESTHHVESQTFQH